MNEAVNYYEEYKGQYKTSLPNENIIPIILSGTTYRSVDILSVYINGFRLNDEEYEIDGTNINLTKDLDVPQTKVDFVALRSVVTSIPFSQLKGDTGDTGSATTLKRWGVN